MLSYKYPYIQVNIPPYTVELQPVFSYPIIRPMDVIPLGGDPLLIQMHPDLVPCILEPPWIKRCKYGIKFTDEINALDSINSGKNEESTEEAHSEKRHIINF